MRRLSRLVGFALDVSGSMAGSITNEAGGELGRLDGLRNALDSIFQELEDLLRVTSETEFTPNDHFFAYAFGIRAPGVQTCDLFHTLENMDELQRLSRQRSYRALDLLRGERTYSTQEIVDRWSKLRGGLNMGNELIGGGTPMREALRQINARFRKERTRFSADDCTLLILSDGEADTDPVGEARQLRQEGIRIISCFVASRDIATPRNLPDKAESKWPRGATNLFEMASTIEDSPAEKNYFSRMNWSFNSNSRLFAQVNHSGMLTEMFQSLIEPMRLESSS